MKRKKFDSNEKFLESIHIRVAFIDCGLESLDRIFEMVDRTNQLNYTKNRMSKKEIESMLEDSSIISKCIQVMDDFGDKGFVGFYAIKNKTLIHFLFSCRILSMGIEQWVYSYLNDPDLTIIGKVAIPLIKRAPCKDYIELVGQDCTTQKNNMTPLLTRNYIDESRLTTIYALGACDMFYLIENLAAPCNRIIRECNTFKGNHRSVNVGTEYIRSSFDMNNDEKQFSKKYFYNYLSEDVFQPKIFDKTYDYVLLSFLDDFLYQIWENKHNPNLRIVRNNEPIIGDDFNILTQEESEEWLEKHFQEPYFIEEKSFLSRLCLS